MTYEFNWDFISTIPEASRSVRAIYKDCHYDINPTHLNDHGAFTLEGRCSSPWNKHKRTINIAYFKPVNYGVWDAL